MTFSARYFGKGIDAEGFRRNLRSVTVPTILSAKQDPVAQ
jgi:hypothetical protein